MKKENASQKDILKNYKYLNLITIPIPLKKIMM